MDSSDRCRAILEDQVATLRKQLASQEHNLSTAREDLKEVQQQLRRKVRKIKPSYHHPLMGLCYQVLDRPSMVK